VFLNFGEEMDISESIKQHILGLASKEDSDEPKLGIFWFNPNTQILFGVRKVIADSIPFDTMGFRTIKELHKDIWQDIVKETKDFDFRTDYTLVPRGRIFEERGEGFLLMCGSWIKPYIVKLVVKEFNLEQYSLKVEINTHWEIGNGWAE
jgi:hypothetical protein